MNMDDDITDLLGEHVELKYPSAGSVRPLPEVDAAVTA